MQMDQYCERCLENFTDETIWNAFEYQNEIICEKCLDEIYA